MPILRLALFSASLLLAASCGGADSSPKPPRDPYAGEPPLGPAIDPLTEGTAILDSLGDPTGWTWIPFPDSICNDATVVGTRYELSTSSTGLAVNWGTGTELVVFLQGGGACWDFATCGGLTPLGVDATASTGPFGPLEFATTVYAGYPNAWLHRANLPPAIATATLVFVPYCTGDIHGGSRVTTYTKPPELAGLDLPAVTWHHAGHTNLLAFLKRLGATFPSPSKVLVAGSSAGGFGALVNYPAFRWYWPDAKSYLIDDSGPPLIGGAVPSSTRAAWYASWDIGSILDAFCAGCRTDMSLGLAELSSRFPDDRIGLICNLEDDVLRSFLGTYTIFPPAFTPMDAATFETELRLLATSVIAPTSNAKYFLSDSPFPGDHPALDDPTVVSTPAPGLVDWLTKMVSDDAAWSNTADP